MMRTKGRIRAADKAGITFRNSVRDFVGWVKRLRDPAFAAIRLPLHVGSARRGLGLIPTLLPFICDSPACGRARVLPQSLRLEGSVKRKGSGEFVPPAGQSCARMGGSPVA